MTIFIVFFSLIVNSSNSINYCEFIEFNFGNNETESKRNFPFLKRKIACFETEDHLLLPHSHSHKTSQLTYPGNFSARCSWCRQATAQYRLTQQ